MDITKDVQKYLDEMADSLVEIDSQKDLQKTIVDNAEEKCSVDKTEFKEAARLYYLKKYHPEKFDKAKGKAEIIESVDNVDV